MGIRRGLVIGLLATASVAAVSGLCAALLILAPGSPLAHASAPSHVSTQAYAPTAQPASSPTPVALAPSGLPADPDTPRVRHQPPTPQPSAPPPVASANADKPADPHPASADSGKQPPVQEHAPQAQPVYKVATQKKEVVLTIDDGPSKYTASLLATLEAEHVPATFFWLGGNNGTNLAADVAKAGSEIGTHTMSHPYLNKMDAAAQKDQLTRSINVLTKASGAEIHYFRPPYGAYNLDTLRIAAELNLQVILWNVDSRDWALADHPELIVPGVMQQVKPGSIILIHERAQTVKVLPDLIKALRDAGYEFRLLPAPDTAH